MKNLKENLYFKMAIIILLAILLLLPSAMIQGLVQERKYNQQYAVEEICSKWSGSQTISGPFITIPYDRYENRTINNRQKSVKVKDFIYILPEKLDIASDVSPQDKERGIYKAVVYNSEIKIEGEFRSIDLNTLGIPEDDIHLEDARLNLGISDLKGVQGKAEMEWNESSIAFESGIPSDGIVSSGMSLPLSADSMTIEGGEFKTDLSLKGSQRLYFLPLGKESHFEMAAAWKSPKFNGNYLPDEWEYTEDGVTASWNVLHLNRNYPQVWSSYQSGIHESAFGTDFFISIDRYHKSHRVAKYALLFVAITFLIFFFVEVLQKVRIHPMQYLLVGLALVIFYTLLLSISEHISYNKAYVVSVALTVGLIAFYVRSILKQKQLVLLTTGLLTIMYGFIFTIIQMEDFALLIGSLGMFIILAIVMTASRKINWYSLAEKNTVSPESEGATT